VTVKRPPQQRYADLLLERPVEDFIAERRANDLSYRRIAADLRDATSGEIDVSDVTIRAWHLRAPDQAEDVA
jgi:hypothetical protein